jgi:hypothetical protein
MKLLQGQAPLLLIREGEHLGEELVVGELPGVLAFLRRSHLGRDPIGQIRALLAPRREMPRHLPDLYLRRFEAQEPLQPLDRHVPLFHEPSLNVLCKPTMILLQEETAEDIVEQKTAGPCRRHPRRRYARL